MKDTSRIAQLARLGLRVSLAASFLSAVADRFGLWGPPGAANVAWGTWDAFLQYTGILLWFPPPVLVSAAGWTATVLELSLAVGLLLGWRLRWFALASALLLFSFGMAMTLALGWEPAFSYSVWTAAAAAFMLASLDDHRGSAAAQEMGPPPAS